MLKPVRLRPGDTVAIVSLSAGTLGEPRYIHKYYLAKERLERDYGFRVIAMPNALKGKDYLYRHPEARAEDLMDAFRDSAIRGVISAIGGDDTIRLLPYIDFDVFRTDPKVFTGFSDTTSNHFMLYKAGVMSYYGPCVMCNFAEYGGMNAYTAEMIRRTLIEPEPTLEIPAAPFWYDDEDERIFWGEENVNRTPVWHTDGGEYDRIQGEGAGEGELLGGCADVFIDLMGTALWPSREEWRGKLLFLETSEMDMDPELLRGILRNLAAQGIFDRIAGILVGRPARRSRWEAYKEVYRSVVGFEAHRPDLPILGNVNFGHAQPIGVIPIGARARIDAERKTFTLLESATE